jgi:hypothetical protein
MDVRLLEDMVTGEDKLIQLTEKRIWSYFISALIETQGDEKDAYAVTSSLH